MEGGANDLMRGEGRGRDGAMELPRIGFLAPAPLTNGYTAARRFAAHFAGRVDGLAGFREVPLKTHAAIVQAAAAGEIEYGVIAVENTLDGIIVESIRELERLFETETVKRPYICWEELLPIRHLLISRTGKFGDVRRIASHASALRQCSRFLGAVQQARPEIEFTQALSTGDGVEQALGDEGVAAMASPEALERHEPELREVVLGEAMASGELKWDDGAWLTDVRGGLTRFWILGPQPMPPMRDARVRVTQRDQLAQITGTEDHDLQKTCYLLNLADKPGSVHRALGAFASRQINVACVYPYPRLGRQFEYLYFVEIEGHAADPLVAEAEDEINGGAAGRPERERNCILLGSYPNTALLQRHGIHREEFRRAHYPEGMVWRE